MTGGGSLIPEIEEIFHRHPAGYDHRLRVRHLEKPHDLHKTDNRAIPIDDLPFMVVAYGLTFDSQEVPERLSPLLKLARRTDPLEPASIGKM